MKDYFTLILGMFVVTYLPRLIPLTLLTSKKVSKKMEQFLLYVPYTSLSILIIRGIITESSSMKLPTILGILVSGALAYGKGNLVISVAMGILTAFITLNIMA